MEEKPRTAPRSTVRTGALLSVLLMLLADVSGGLLSTCSQVAEFEEPIPDGLPPLMWRGVV